MLKWQPNSKSMTHPQAVCHLPRRGLFRFSGVLPATLLAGATASAGVVFFTSSAAFDATLGAAPKVIEDYEAYTADSTIANGTVLNGIRYDTFPAGTQGRIDNTFSAFDSRSLALDRGSVPPTPDYFFDGDQLSISFTTPVRAFGVFFNANLTPNTTDLSVVTPVGTASTGGPTYDTDTFYFAGLISDTPFTTATIGSGVLPNGSSFNLDNLTYSTVPEPGATLGVLGLVGLAVAWRSRRHAKASQA